MLFLGVLYLCAATLASEINADEAKAKQHEDYAAQVLMNAEGRANQHKSYAKHMRERAKLKRIKYYQQRFKAQTKSISNPTVTTTVTTPVTVNNTNKNNNSTVILNSPKASSQATVSKRPADRFVILDEKTLTETETETPKTSTAVTTKPVTPSTATADTPASTIATPAASTGA